jgi:hypothetical protein
MIWVVVIVLVIGLAVGIVSTIRLTGWRPGQRTWDEEEGLLADRKVATLTGTVRLIGEPLISPLSANRCVVFETFVSLYEWPKEDDSEAAKDAPKVLSGQIAKREIIPFELVTAAGVVLVEATEVDLELSPTPVYPRFPEREARFLREHEKDERLIENATFEEITIDPDALVSVHGLVIVESPTKARLVSDGDNPIVIGVPRASVIV